MIRSRSLLDLRTISADEPTKPKISPRSFFRGSVVKKIPQQAADVTSGLVKTKKVARQELERVPEIQSVGATTNHIFCINNLGFLKVGFNGYNATAIMERLIWETSSVFRVQALFSPTTEMMISPRKAMKMSVDVQIGITPQQEKRFKKYSLDDLSESRKLKGSFQIAEKGMLLIEFIEEGKPLASISGDENQAMMNLIDAIVTSLGFGMEDAHSKNIFVTRDGKFRFFDNTRCFPHSNSVLTWADDIRLTYRCGLLQLPECHQMLTPTQKKYLLEVVEKFKNNLAAFEEFIKSEEVQKRVAELPLGWFDTELVLKATRVRIEKLNLAALSETVNSLVDLVCETVPYYRFFSFIYFIQEKLIEKPQEEKSWRLATVCAPTVPLAKALFVCHDYSINPYTLLGLSMQSNFTVSKFCTELKKLLVRKDSNLDHETITQFATQFYHIENIDFKEIPENEVKECLVRHHEECFSAFDIPIEEEEDEGDISQFPYYIEMFDEPWILVINIPKQRKKTIELDIYSSPGRIKIVGIPDLPAMKIHAFKEWIEKFADSQSTSSIAHVME